MNNDIFKEDAIREEIYKLIDEALCKKDFLSALLTEAKYLNETSKDHERNYETKNSNLLKDEQILK